MVAIEKPVSKCCEGQIFLIRGLVKDVEKSKLELNVEIQDCIYGCRVCGKECEVMEEKEVQK